MYAAEPDVSSELDTLSSFALEMAASHIKDAKVIVLESLLLEAVSQIDSTTGDHKKARSAISLQKAFISSNSLGITEDDICAVIMRRANDVNG